MQEPQTQGITVTREQIGSYLSSLGDEGGTPAQYPPTERSWSCCMPPCPAAASPGHPAQWREQLLDQGYSPSTVNTSVSAANSFLEWLGCREFQLTGRLSCGRDAQLELTRSRIPAPAVHRPGSETGAGLSADQAVHLHRIAGPRAGTGDGGGGGRGVLLLPGEAMPQRLPDCLRRELLDYARRQGISSGPIFVTRTGRPCGRAGVSVSIRRLCRMPRLPRKRATRGACGSCITPPERRSRPLWPSWWSRPMERLLEAEQAAVGWGGCQEVRGA